MYPERDNRPARGATTAEKALLERIADNPPQALRRRDCVLAGEYHGALREDIEIAPAARLSEHWRGASEFSARRHAAVIPREVRDPDRTEAPRIGAEEEERAEAGRPEDGLPSQEYPAEGQGKRWTPKETNANAAVPPPHQDRPQRIRERTCTTGSPQNNPQVSRAHRRSHAHGVDEKLASLPSGPVTPVREEHR